MGFISLQRKRELFLFSSVKFPARFVKTVNKELLEYRERAIEREIDKVNDEGKDDKQIPQVSQRPSGSLNTTHSHW